jgi:hypothetical protein
MDIKFQDVPLVPPEVPRTQWDFFNGLRRFSEQLRQIFNGSDDDWTYPSLLNGMQLVDGWAPVGYRKDPVGNVHLQGLVAGTASSTSTGYVFILPVGFRPNAKLIFSQESNTGAARIDVHDDGVVHFYSGGSGWATLSGMIFKADQ